MPEIETVQVETLQGTDAPGQQPAFQPEPQLTEEAVRAAVMAAEAQGEDPTTLSVGSVQGLEPVQEPEKSAPPVIPEKFKTPTGEVDVEKLKASTRQLDEVVKKKEAAVQKTVEDYLREYQELEHKNTQLPNPQKLAAQLSSAQIPVETPQRMTDQQLMEMINRDMQANPAGTVAQLIEIALERRLQPFEQDKKTETVRSNIAKIAEKDVRILDPEIFKAVNAKLESDPDLRRLKNPHKAAWLEVKEELRLGEPAPSGQVSAQPSKPPSPILGGGTPPPAPSSSGSVVTAQSLISAIDQIAPKDPRDRKTVDPKQREVLDKAAKEYFDRVFR